MSLNVNSIIERFEEEKREKDVIDSQKKIEESNRSVIYAIESKARYEREYWETVKQEQQEWLDDDSWKTDN